MAESKLIAVRVSDELLTRIDAHARRLKRLAGLGEATRSLAIKSALERGLASFENEEAAAQIPKKR